MTQALDKLDKLEKQQSNQNLLLAGIAVGTFVQARQTEKLTKAVSNLEKELSFQSGLLGALNETQAEVLSETKKQTHLLEASERRIALEKATQQAVFELNLKLKELDNMGSNIEKHFNANLYLGLIDKYGLSVENLPGITEKEYFYDVIEKLKKISQLSLESITTEEADDLTAMDAIKSKLQDLIELRSKSKEAKEKIKQVKAQKTSDIVKNFNLNTQAKPIISFKSSIGLSVLGIGMLISAPIHNLALVFILGLVLTPIGLIAAISVALGSAAMKAKSGVENKTKRVKDLAESKRNEIIRDIESNFYSKNHVSLKYFDEKISLIDLEKECSKNIKNLHKSFSKILDKYPSLELSGPEIITKSSNETAADLSGTISTRSVNAAVNKILKVNGTTDSFILSLSENPSVYVQGYFINGELYLEAAGSEYSKSLTKGGAQSLQYVGWRSPQNDTHNFTLQIQGAANKEAELAEILVETFKCYETSDGVRNKLKFELV